MKDTKLVNILRTFSKDEIKEFEKFAASPYHSTGKNCLPLLKQLQKFHPDFDSKTLSYENIYKKLYPGKKFNKQVMWNLTSAMEKMIDEFLIHQRLKADRFTKYTLLLLELSSKNVPKYYQRELMGMKEFSDNLKIGEDDNTGIDFFKVMWKYEAVRSVYYQTIDKLSLMGDFPVKRSEYLILSFIQHLTVDIYNTYFIEKMYNYSFEYKLSNKFIESINFTELIKYVNNNNFKYAWVIEFYFNKIMCLFKPDEEHFFFDLKKMFEDRLDSFTRLENQNTISTLTNYCLDKIRNGNENYFNVLFKINKTRLNKNLAFIETKIMRKTIYIQMITTALEINEIQWTMQFIEKYTGNLKEEFQKSISSLANALLYFKLKAYEKVLDNLMNVEFIDVGDKIQVKTLLAKTYYEMNETDSLLHHIDSAKHFLSNNKSVSEDFRKSYGYFFNFLTNIVSIKENIDLFSLQKLKKEINASTELNDKNWLLEKISEINK